MTHCGVVAPLLVRRRLGYVSLRCSLPPCTASKRVSPIFYDIDMQQDDVQYMSQEKLDALQSEFDQLKEEKIPALAKRIDDARQMGDLSENAEYHAAREEMAWAQSQAKKLSAIIGNATLITSGGSASGVIGIGSRLTVKTPLTTKEFTIVGQQEAQPLAGKISNESPLGRAFLGKHKGDTVQVEVPAGVQTYKILEVE